MMGVNKSEYYDWQKATTADKLRFRKASPNLLTIKDWLVKRHGGSSVGIYANRNQRGKDSKSSHAYGAALDWRYETRVAAKNAMKELVLHSAEWGVQMIVDYVGCTIWTPKHGWRKREPDKWGMGQPWAKWLHIETTKKSWNDSRELDARS